MRRSGATVEDLKDEALAVLFEDPDRAVALARDALRRRPDADGFYVCGIALCEAGDVEEGMSALRMAMELDPGHVDAISALAREEFDACEFDEACALVSELLRTDPLHADGHYLRACLRERRGDESGAARDYQAAALAAPGDFPLPVPLSDDAIEAIAEEVLSSLHPSLRRYLENVPILVEEVPPVDVLLELDPPGRPADLLGCFSGHSLLDRSSADPWSALPATITLYRRNLERLAGDREELLEELRVTLLHEIGHFLGLDEEDLHARGLG